MTPALRNRILEAWAGCEGVTPGPWKRYERPSEQETRVHIDRHEVCTIHWARSGLATTAHRDAEYIARLDPDFIREVLTQALRVEELEARVKELEGREQWQDIATAPKDGCGKGTFTGTRGPEIMLSDGDSIYIGFWNGRSWDDGNYYDDLGTMTHWMPVPLNPNPTQQETA